jgi:hypothetical protein
MGLAAGRLVDRQRRHLASGQALIDGEFNLKARQVTWEWSGDHGAVEDRVATVLNSRLSEAKVRLVVEALYPRAWHTLEET